MRHLQAGQGGGQAGANMVQVGAGPKDVAVSAQLPAHPHPCPARCLRVGSNKVDLEREGYQDL